MKIKYLKPAPNATTGDVKDINAAQAKILIQLGFAKEYDENDSGNGNADDLFGQLDDNQNPENKPPTNPEPSKADEVSEQAQDTAENTPAEPATPTETTKPKKTKKTNTENN